jgi:hypothetical protein
VLLSEVSLRQMSGNDLSKGNDCLSDSPECHWMPLIEHVGLDRLTVSLLSTLHHEGRYTKGETRLRLVSFLQILTRY